MKQKQLQTMREKLRLYKKPLIDSELLGKLISSFAPSYEPHHLVKEGLIKVLKNGELYFNLLSTKYITPQAVIGSYCKGTDYMLGGMYAYNLYGYSTQVPEWIEVYSDAYHGKKVLNDVKIIFREVSPSFFFGKLRKKSKGVMYYMMSPERALIELIKSTNGKMEFVDKVPPNVSIKKLQELGQKYCSKRINNLISSLIAKGQMQCL